VGARVSHKKTFFHCVRPYTPFYIACAQIWGRNHDWVVPPIKAHEKTDLRLLPIALSQIY
jgi:hypothetical protein